MGMVQHYIYYTNKFLHYSASITISYWSDMPLLQHLNMTGLYAITLTKKTTVKIILLSFFSATTAIYQVLGITTN
jgi:hypothetical protein